MTTYQIFNYRNYDLAELTYQKPVKSRGNSYNCLVDKSYDTLFQTKDIILKSGIIQTDREAHIDIDVSGTDLEEFIKNMDASNINYIHKKCVDWFDHELPFDTIKEFYISNLVEGVLRLNIPLVRKKIDIRVFDNKKRLIESSELVPGSKVVMVFRVNGLKFLKKECIMDLDVVQIMLMKPNEPNVIVPTKQIKDSVQNENRSQAQEETRQIPKPSNEVLSRIQFRENLKKKKEIARLAFEEAEKAQLEADLLKERASKLAKELKDLEDEYYREEEEVYEEDEDDN